MTMKTYDSKMCNFLPQSWEWPDMMDITHAHEQGIDTPISALNVNRSMDILFEEARIKQASAAMKEAQVAWGTKWILVCTRTK